jgi:hypothetical protein
MSYFTTYFGALKTINMWPKEICFLPIFDIEVFGIINARTVLLLSSKLRLKSFGARAW